MELVDGIPVDRYCDEHRLTIDERLAVFLRICRGVQYARRNLRSQVVLLLLDGHTQVSAARVLGVSRETGSRWERRFAAGGPDALLRDRPGRGRRPGRNAAHVARVVDALRQAPEGTWTVRRLAAHVGVSAATVQRIWREHAAGVNGWAAARVVRPLGASGDTLGPEAADPRVRTHVTFDPSSRDS